MHLKSWGAGNKYIKLFLLLTLRYENITTSEDKRDDQRDERWFRDANNGIWISLSQEGKKKLRNSE